MFGLVIGGVTPVVARKENSSGVLSAAEGSDLEVGLRRVLGVS